jgi:hypothetical protein
MPNTREELLLRGVRLEAGTVLWNTIEGIIVISAGVVASSVGLIGFGIDSFVETASAAVVGWRLGAELTHGPDHEGAKVLERLTSPGEELHARSPTRRLLASPKCHRDQFSGDRLAERSLDRPFAGH